MEDIPGVALHECLDWAWETFPDFLRATERIEHDIDFSAQLPHAALRVYVMGERALRLEMATPEDIARMRGLAAEAIRHGAIGFSTSRSINHRSVTGDPMPSLRAAEEELTGIALGLADAGGGVLEIIIDFDDPDLLEAEFGMMRRLVEKSGRPLSFSMGAGGGRRPAHPGAGRAARGGRAAGHAGQQQRLLGFTLHNIHYATNGKPGLDPRPP